MKSSYEWVQPSRPTFPRKLHITYWRSSISLSLSPSLPCSNSHSKNLMGQKHKGNRKARLQTHTQIQESLLKKLTNMLLPPFHFLWGTWETWEDAYKPENDLSRKSTKYKLVHLKVFGSFVPLIWRTTCPCGLIQNGFRPFTLKAVCCLLSFPSNLTLSKSSLINSINLAILFGRMLPWFGHFRQLHLQMVLSHCYLITYTLGMLDEVYPVFTKSYSLVTQH